MRLLSNSELESLSLSNRKKYYEDLRKYCLSIKNRQIQGGQDIIEKVYPFLRKYKIEIQGEENIPKDSNAIFLVNHSNAHDIFTAYEMLSKLDRYGSVMVATDCLTPITTGIFNISNATLLDRNKKEDRTNSVLEMSKKILNGKDGVIFGESTWNLHPINPMHNLRQGASSISAITQVPIIPTIFEYVENDGFLKSESQLIKKCIIRFASPILIDYNGNLIDQTNEIKQEMDVFRKRIWCDYGIARDKITDIDPLIYVNHTYLKKFKAFGFTYDSKKEQEFLLFLNGEPVENEYTINDSGEFCPGITEKNSELRKILLK